MEGTLETLYIIGQVMIDFVKLLGYFGLAMAVYILIVAIREMRLQAKVRNRHE